MDMEGPHSAPASSRIGLADTGDGDIWRAGEASNGELPSRADASLTTMSGMVHQACSPGFSSQQADWDAFERDIAYLLSTQPVESLPTAHSDSVEPVEIEVIPVPQPPAGNLGVQDGLPGTQQRSAICSLSQYRAKAEELKVKAQADKNPISRAAFENLALSYLLLAGYEERHQLDVKEKAWGRLARENGWYCACGRSISFRDREMYFSTNLCSLCYRASSDRPGRRNQQLATRAQWGAM